MRTKRFCELVELAMMEAYGQESSFDTVPYIPEEGGEMRECLGIFILPDQHMAVVTAQAMKIIFDDTSAETATDDMSHFVVLIHGMRVAPYMQWHCVYFPDLTAEGEADDGPKPYVERTDPGERMSSADLFAEFSNLGGVGTTWYSGRDMMGAQCVSIAADTLDAIQSAIGTVRERANLATRTALSVYRTDSLGRGLITYFPDFTKEQP